MSHTRPSSHSPDNQVDLLSTLEGSRLSWSDCNMLRFRSSSLAINGVSSHATDLGLHKFSSKALVEHQAWKPSVIDPIYCTTRPLSIPSPFGQLFTLYQDHAAFVFCNQRVQMLTQPGTN